MRTYNNSCNTSLAPINIALHENSTSEGANKIFGLIINGDKQKSSLEHGTTEQLLWKSNFKQMCFEYFPKGGYSFRRFSCTMELITDCCVERVWYVTIANLNLIRYKTRSQRQYLNSERYLVVMYHYQVFYLESSRQSCLVVVLYQ